jgi:hypothetical protein
MFPEGQTTPLVQSKEGSILRKFRFVIAGLTIIVANQALGYAVQAARPETALAAGNTRYYVAQAASLVSTGSKLWQDIPGMSTTITMPSGKHGDVMLLFCGVAATAGEDLLLRATIGGTPAVPQDTVLTEWTAAASNCAFFYKLGLATGSKAVKVQWHATSVYISLVQRSLMVMVNMH